MSSCCVRAFVLVLLLPLTAAAQPAPPDAATTAVPAGAAAQDDDLQVVLGEPEFTLSALPTTLRMPTRKFAFRLTHRFTRTIGEGDVGDFFADFFGFDSSARVGFELRYGIRPGTQATVHRTNDRDIQFLGQHQIVRQSETQAFSLDAIGAIDGANNFSEDFSGTLGAAISHRFGDRGALYAQPLFVINSNVVSEDIADDNHTFLFGLGGRWRLSRRVYVVAEVAPRVGYAEGAEHVSVGIETRAGGHMFQFTVTNSLGTTMRQIARGGFDSDDWFVGFNLTRRFF